MAFAKPLGRTENVTGRIALTDSTTMGLGLMYRGLRLSPGDEIVTTEHEFYATHVLLRRRRPEAAPRFDSSASTTIRLRRRVGASSTRSLVR